MKEFTGRRRLVVVASAKICLDFLPVYTAHGCKGRRETEWDDIALKVKYLAVFKRRKSSNKDNKTNKIVSFMEKYHQNVS